jgi:DNA-binding response OmpR family regulator
MRVLVVDYEKFSKTVFESELHQQNIEVDLAGDGEEALSLIKKNKPDLMVLELILPKLNGFDLLKNLKSKKIYSRIPVVVYSRLNQKKDKEEANLLDIDGYFSKDDFSTKQVVKEILNILMAI